MKQPHLPTTLLVIGLGLFAGACAKKHAEGGHHEDEQCGEGDEDGQSDQLGGVPPQFPVPDPRPGGR